MSGASLYDTDYYAWTLEQAAALRGLAAHRSNVPIDILNLAEEVEDLGKSELRHVFSLYEQILLHLLKIEFSPVADPIRHWQREVTNFRILLNEALTRSLERKLLDAIPVRYAIARNKAIDALEPDDPAIETRLPPDCPYSLDQVLGRMQPAWFPV